MKKTITFLILLIILLNTTSFAVSANKQNINKKPKVLLLYTIDQEDDYRFVRIMDVLVGHFTNDITVMSADKFKVPSKKLYTHIIFLGYSEKSISKKIVNYLENFQGPLFIGYKAINNFKNRFNYIHADHEVCLTELLGKKRFVLKEKNIAMNVKTNKNIILSGKVSKTKVPLIIKKDKDYYMANKSLYPPTLREIGEVLFDFFEVPKKNKNLKKYLRLEDIHPAVPADILRPIADYLKKENIPCLITVIPVYTNPKTGKKLHYKDNEELVKVLKSMQDNGASIVLHGYTHQYRTSETGEGYEFWDIKYDRPIFQEYNSKALVRKDFNFDSEYEKYIEEGFKFERKYIQARITNGINELVAHGLYPIAFEAPHYSMSDTGFKVIGEHFSTYVGQMHTSNKSGIGTISVNYTTSPSFASNIFTIPETLGYVNPNNANSFTQIQENTEIVSLYTDAYLGVFYHPYLGIKGLKKVIKTLNSIKEAKWFNLKEMDNSVKLPSINIRTKNGKIIVKKKHLITSKYEAMYILKKYYYWIFIFFFLSFLLYLINRKKRFDKIYQSKN